LANFYIQDFLHGFLATDVVEGGLSHEQFVGENAQTPQIDGVVVFDSLKNFRGRIVEGPAVSFPAF
jgi:hypothetical protein